MSDLSEHIKRMERHAHAPMLISKVADDEDTQDVAEVAAELAVELREKCQERGLGKHAGQAICYMIVDKLSEEGKDE